MEQEKETFKFDTFFWDDLNKKECWDGLKEECQTDEFRFDESEGPPFNWDREDSEDSW